MKINCRMFYFFFESRNNRSTDPVVVWLSGGPGCSGSLALFYENGPFHLAKNLSLVWNDFGWDKVIISRILNYRVGWAMKLYNKMIWSSNAIQTVYRTYQMDLHLIIDLTKTKYQTCRFQTSYMWTSQSEQDSVILLTEETFALAQRRQAWISMTSCRSILIWWS